MQLEQSWVSLAGALAAALRATGIQAPIARVMGVSGLAFRFALPLTDGIATGSAEPSFDPAVLAVLTSHLGRQVTVTEARPGQSDYAAGRALAIRRVGQSVARGRPAVVWDLHLPRFGLVTGVEADGQAWRVATMLSGQFGGRLPLERWLPPERPSPVLVLTLGRRLPVRPAQAVRETLAFALAYAGRGDPGDPTGALHGAAALRRWAEAFRVGEPVDPAGNALLVQMLQAARRDAAVFLRGDAARHLPAAADGFRRAAAAYDAEVLALSRMTTVFPYPAGGDPEGPAARLVAGAALHEALAREQEALAAVRAGLALDD